MCTFLWKLASLFKIRIEAKQIHCLFEFSQSQWLAQCIDLQKNGDKDGKAWYKLMNNVTTDKTT